MEELKNNIQQIHKLIGNKHIGRTRDFIEAKIKVPPNALADIMLKKKDSFHRQNSIERLAGLTGQLLVELRYKILK